MRGRFGVEPLVVMNCSYRRDIPTERPWLLHDAIGLARTGRVVLYHGGLAPERGIDELIEAVLGLADDVHVALLGYGPLEEPLRRRAAAPSSKGRVHVLPAVPPQDLIRWVASADVVAMPIQPTTLNHRLTTPNKLFEALTAGVPVVASDLPGMAPIVRETGCGAVCDPRDVSSIATAISSILDLPPEAYRALRGRTAAAARDRYSWESQFDVLLAEYTRLTGRAW